MVRDIAAAMKNTLLDLYDKDEGVITSLAGLTQVKDILLSDLKKLRKIPVPVDGGYEEAMCDGEPLFDLVPDIPRPASKKRCIVYFESSKVNHQQTVADGLNKYSAIITLICWYNTNLYQTKENLTTGLISMFMRRINVDYPAMGALQKLKILSYTPQDNDPSIFAKYTYNDFRKPYLGYPYGYFKIDFNINFQINETCTQNIIIIDNNLSC